MRLTDQPESLEDRICRLERQQFQIKRTLRSTMQIVNGGTLLDRQHGITLRKLIKDTREIQFRQAEEQSRETAGLKKEQRTEERKRRKDRVVLLCFVVLISIGYLKGELESGKILDVLIQAGLLSALGVYSATDQTG